MNIKSPLSTEDYIYLYLQEGTLPIVKLIEKIRLARPKTTKQGVYAIIRKLKRQEVVVTYKKNISLSSIWLLEMKNFIDKAMYSTKHITSPENIFLNLQNGEKVQYFFKTPVLTDAFWSHVFTNLIEVSSPQIPVLIYNPHEWFLLARTENEISLFNRISDRGQKLFILIGNNSKLDKFAGKYLRKQTTAYETLAEPISLKPNYYVNVIADFIIEVWIDQKIQKEIDEFYLENTEINPILKNKLEKILMQKGKNKFSVTHNKNKADALRKKFKKHFFL